VSDTLVKVENVSKKFCRSLKKSLWYGMKDLGSELIGRSHGRNDDLRPDEFWAVKDVSFELKRSECLGFIGRNGAGKTTLLRMLNGLIKPDKGKIEIRGRVGALIALGAGFNPILTGRENIYVNASVLGLKKKEIDLKYDEIVDFAELGDFIDTPVQSYSSGMQIRLGFAIAASLNPSILLIDEILAVGDLLFQRKCIRHMMKYIHEGGSIIFVAHNLHLIQSICTIGIFLNSGITDFKGLITDTIRKYQATNKNVTKNLDSSTEKIKYDSPFPVTIKSLTIGSINNDYIQTGDSVKIVIEIQTQTPPPQPIIWGFSLWTGDNWIRIATNTSDWDGFRYELQRGSNILSCIIPNFPLMTGEYLE
jgi:lipopolysaccharide transport system ATP-binding protein